MTAPPIFAIPNVNVPVQEPSGFLNPAWYLFFTSLKTQAVQGSGVTSVAAGGGLSTDPASAGTITSSGTLYLNLDYYGATEGALLYRGPETWEEIAPGAAGTFLESNGADAAPSWAPASEILPVVNPGDVLGNVGSIPQPATDVLLTAILDIVAGNQQGMIIFRGPEVWQALAPGTANQILTSGGPGYNVFWADAAPNPLARYMAAPIMVGGVRVIEGISCDGTQNSGLSTGVGS